MNNSANSQAFGFQQNASQMTGDKQGSLKMKLANLEVSNTDDDDSQDLIRNIAEEVEYHKKECQILRVEKEQLENVLAVKATDVRKNLQDEANRVSDDLKKNLSGQKTENQKLQNQISILKQEKTQLQQNLLGLQRRIGELELSIGETD